MEHGRGWWGPGGDSRDQGGQWEPGGDDKDQEEAVRCRWGWWGPRAGDQEGTKETKRRHKVLEGDKRDSAGPTQPLVAPVVAVMG